MIQRLYWVRTEMRFLAALCLLGGLLPTNARGENQLTRLTALEKRGTRVSTLGFALDSGEILWEHNATTSLVPASVSKLVMGAAALEKWGSDHTFTTRFWTNGSQQGDTLKGDLIFEGVGDPYLTNEKIWFLATDVARRGIRKIQGNLVLNASRFDRRDRDRSRSGGRNASRNAYDSPLSAIGVNFGVLAAVISPGSRTGVPATVDLEPFTMPGFAPSGNVTTSKPSSRSSLKVTRRNDKTGDTILMSGAIPAESFPERVYRSVSEAEPYAGAVLRTFLEKSGVSISGQTRVDDSPLPKGLIPVAQVEGYPLSWQMAGLMKVSNNYIADMLTLQLAPAPAATLANGAAELERFVHEATKRSTAYKACKGKITPIRMISGSGLTPENRLSARDVVAILENLYENPREFPTLLAALPIPGSEGTVRTRFNTPEEIHLRDRVRAKTGTLTEPFSAVGLAGYARLPKKGWIAFAFLVNGQSGKNDPGVVAIRSAIDADLARLLPATP